MKVTEPVSVAVVGVGKIARDQHLPSITRSPSFKLAATVSRNASVEGVDNFADLDAFLTARPDVPVVSLCMPPQVRFDYAWAALKAGRHVLLEKPPGATLSEVEALRALADEKGLTLFATWHSRFSPAAAPAKAWLAQRTIRKVEIDWKEDVRRWHPGQTWIWKAGGVGVFDPGINALSILTEIMPEALHLTTSELIFPENCETPIAALLAFRTSSGAPAQAEFDWRHTGHQAWNITVETDDGVLTLGEGGATMAIDGAERDVGPEAEYDAIYGRFAELLRDGASDVDLTPLVHVADAFMLGKRVTTEAFVE